MNRQDPGDGEGDGGVASIAAALERLSDTIALARVLVQSGAAVDLAGLDQEVGDLCAGAIALPRAEARDMASPLSDLLAELEQLERVMERRPPTR